MGQPGTNLANQGSGRDPVRPLGPVRRLVSKPTKLAQPHPGLERCPAEPRHVGSDPWPGGCRCGRGDTMNAFAADDLAAPDLLALAQLDDGGAPSPGSVTRSQPAGLNPDNGRGDDIYAPI